MSTDSPAESSTSADDRAQVEALIGRPPQCAFEVVVRDAAGGPVVVRNAPFLDDGTPMPTRYYLVGTELVRAVSRVEADGGVRRAEAELADTAVAAAHAAYAAERDTAIAADHDGPRPSGGVGGTRQGVKCLHAHLAHLLAGGADAVGSWTLDQLRDAGVDVDTLDPPPPAAEPTQLPTADPAPANPQPGGLTVDIGDHSVSVTMTGGGSWTLPVGTLELLDGELGRADPPKPSQLTNALGLVNDHVDDIIVEAPTVLATPSVTVVGHHAESLARTEVGLDHIDERVAIERSDLDEVFRTVVAEPLAERIHNPGLDAEHVETIVPTLCIVLAIVRRLGLDSIEVASWR